MGQDAQTNQHPVSPERSGLIDGRPEAGREYGKGDRHWNRDDRESNAPVHPN